MSSHHHQPCTPANPSWIWSGVHGASGIVHPFLAIRDDLEGRYSGLGAHYDCANSILAGSGGLLLIKRSPLDIGTRRRIAALLRSRRLLGAGADYRSKKLNQQWQPLLVVNPSTHESRVLPPANSTEVGLEFWSYNAVQANLLVDAESQTYRVTLTFPDFVCLYKSTSNAWQYRSFNQGASWGPHSTSNPWQRQSFNQGASWRALSRELLATPWEMQIANAHVNGRLFFADVVLDDPIHTMNLIEIDVEAGTWKLHNWRYPLQCLQRHFTEFVNTPLLRMRGLTDHEINRALNTETLASRRRGRLLENFQIVECMGELYAVIPMGLSEYLPMSLRSQRTLTEVVHEYANFGLSFMPLQFLIVNMRGDGFVHGVLRTVVPEDVHNVFGGGIQGVDNEGRQKILMDMLGSEPRDGFSWGFSCVAEGSVIWVALLDYVLQYDVVTGVSKTEIIEASTPATSLDIWVERVPYRPSDMKP